jgi:hypothetical protein
MVDEIISILRELAKSDKFQTLFMLSKEGSFTFFKNRYDYSAYQMLFINLLSTYHNIYTEISLDYVDEIVLNNETYEDAYLYYRRKVGVDELMKNGANNTERPVNSNQKIGQEKSQTSFSWLFKPSKSS